LVSMITPTPSGTLTPRFIASAVRAGKFT